MTWGPLDDVAQDAPLFVISVAGLILIGNQYRWLPSIVSLRALALKLPSRTGRRQTHV